MKKQLLLAYLLWISTVAAAQDSVGTVSHGGKSDLLLDPVYLIVAPALNVSYERFLNKDYGVGLHALLGLGALDTDAQLSPYIRMYMGRHHANGFFLEAFLPITTEVKDRGWSRLMARHTTLGLGVGAGGKWIVKNNIVLEFSGALGRRFFYDGGGEPVTGKWMMGVGYRFK